MTCRCSRAPCRGLRAGSLTVRRSRRPGGPRERSCLSRTRDGSAIETVLAECPGRFEVGERSLGEGDRCTVRRKEAGMTGAMVHNRSYSKGEQ